MFTWAVVYLVINGHTAFGWMFLFAMMFDVAIIELIFRKVKNHD